MEKPFFVEIMSKNNLIRNSDKKFIRLQKSRIRRQFLDVKKQEEAISELYKKFLPATATVGAISAEKPKTEKVVGKKETAAAKAPASQGKKEKTGKEKIKAKKEKAKA